MQAVCLTPAAPVAILQRATPRGAPVFARRAEAAGIRSDGADPSRLREDILDLLLAQQFEDKRFELGAERIAG